jgi:hypothetical protein
MSEPKVDTEGFYGTVVLKDWMPTMDERMVRRVTGICRVVRDADFGLKVKGSESNWGIRVAGAETSWTILGCQIRAVIVHSSEQRNNPEGCEVVT